MLVDTPSRWELQLVGESVLRPSPSSFLNIAFRKELFDHQQQRTRYSDDLSNTGLRSRQRIWRSALSKAHSLSIIEPDLLSFPYYLVRILRSIVHLAGNTSGVVTRRVPSKLRKVKGRVGLVIGEHQTTPDGELCLEPNSFVCRVMSVFIHEMLLPPPACGSGCCRVFRPL